MSGMLTSTIKQSPSAGRASARNGRPAANSRCVRTGHRLFTGFLRDLTERQQTLDRLQDLQSQLSHVSRLTEMGQMASALAHEINQPLTAATNYFEAGRRLLARGDAAGVERARGIFDSAAAQVVRATQIIRRLRDFVGKGEGNRRGEPVAKLIEKASALALIGVKDSDVRIELQVAPQLPEALVDRIQLQQVVVNLIRNAVEATEGCAWRELTLAADGMIAISVADAGPGIAPEVAIRLFQLFVTTKAQELGVGLSICRAIVEAHGGAWAPRPTRPAAPPSASRSRRPRSAVGEQIYSAASSKTGWRACCSVSS
jgi:two-component system, LuxR family, sensor kinase FixL